MRRNQSKSAKESGKSARKGGLSFGFFLLVVGVMACCGLLMVLLQQLALRNDLAARRVEERVSAELTKQKKLRLDLAKLQSPGRVARIARDDLGMAEPAGVIYLKYAKDAQGNIACSSTYESWSEALPKAQEEQKPESPDSKSASAGDEKKTAGTQASAAEKEPAKALTKK